MMRFMLHPEGRYDIFFSCGIGIRGSRVMICLNDAPTDCLVGAEITEEAVKNSAFGSFRRFVCEKRAENVPLRTILDVYADKVFIQVLVDNCGAEPVALGKCSLLQTAPTGFVDAGTADSVRINCRDMWQCHSETRKLSDDPTRPDLDVINPERKGHALRDPARHRSTIVGDLYSLERNACLDTGFLTFDRANTVVYYHAEGNTVHTEAVSDFAGYALQPGQHQQSEILRIAADSSFHSCMTGWAEDVAVHYQPRFIRKPALGAIGDTWDSRLNEDGCYEDAILRTARGVHHRLKGFGFEYFWISLYNIKDIIPGHWLDVDYDEIPSGLDGLAKKLEALGLKLGLWMAPYWIPDRFSDQPQTMQDQMLHRDGQPIVDQARWLRGISGKYPPDARLNFYLRDGSSKAAQDYIRDVFRQYRQMGIRYYMIDFLRGGAGGLYGEFDYNGYADKTKIAGPEVFRELLKVIREEAGDDTYMLSSTGPSLHCLGFVDGFRTGPDIGEGREAKPGYTSYPATYHIHHRDMLRSACRNMASMYHTNGRLGHADSFNVISVDKPIPVSEAQASLSMAALFASPMMLGDCTAALSEERLRMLKRALPQNDPLETAIPVDLFERLSPDCPRIYNLPIQRSWGSYGVVGLLNVDEVPQTYAVDLKKLGYDGPCAVYDFWDERFLGILEGSCAFTVPATSCKVLRITPWENKPVVVGTDMHVLQGAVEIVNIEYRADTLVVGCKRPVGEKGTVSVLAPISYIPQTYVGFHTARVGMGDLMLVSKHFCFDNEITTVNFPFQKGVVATQTDPGDERKV